MLIRKFREAERKPKIEGQSITYEDFIEWHKVDKDDKTNILCIEIAGLCHDLGI